MQASMLSAMHVFVFYHSPQVQYLYLANEGIVALLLKEKSFIKFIK